MPRLFCGLLPVFVFFLSVIAQNIAVAEETAPYPVTIKHAFGTTTIAKKPERVATVAWANHEVPLALGIVPVGFAAANFGDDDGDGLLPWVAKRLSELDAPKPVLFDEGDGIDFEAVAATQRMSSSRPIPALASPTTTRSARSRRWSLILFRHGRRTGAT